MQSKPKWTLNEPFTPTAIHRTALRPLSLPMPPLPHCHIDIPLLPQTALGHALHLVECLRSANLLARLRSGPAAPGIRWRFCDARGEPLAADSLGPFIAPLAHEGAFTGPATALLLAPLHCPDIPAVRAATQAHTALVRRIGIAVDQGQQVISVSNGAWLAAASARLDGRRVALPWYYVAGFVRDFPGIEPAPAQSLVQDGPWLSADVATGSIGIALALTRQAMGPETAEALSAAAVADPARSHAAHSAAGQIPNTRDSTLARAIAHLEKALDQPYCLADVALAAAVSPRTLLRHFREALGHSPLDHLHGLRCARARVLLEITLESIPSIAQACGYSDPAAFRRVFARHAGMAPGAYRERHTLRAPRQRWRVDATPQP